MWGYTCAPCMYRLYQQLHSNVIWNRLHHAYMLGANSIRYSNYVLYVVESRNLEPVHTRGGGGLGNPPVCTGSKNKPRYWI